MYRYKIIILFLFIVIGYSGRTQNTTSPYSIFGPGEIQQKGFGKLQGMGGVGIGLKSGNFLNNLNPASYTGLDSLHYIYSVGVESKFSNFNQQGKSKNDVTANFKYFALGFRIDDWWFASMGLTPFTNVGYDIITQSYVEGANSTYHSEYVGTGGISQVYFSNAFKLTKNLSVGINSSYMFGSIIQEESVSQQVLFTNYKFIRTDYLKSLYFDYGLQYSFKLKNLDYTFGAIYSQNQNLDSRHQVTVRADGNVVAYQEEDLEYIEIPDIYGFGIAIQNGQKLTVAADYQFQKWSGVSYPTQIDDFVDSHSFTLGSEFRPWTESVINKGYKNWTYRAGLNYSSSYVKVGKRILDKKSISLGIGVPIKNEKSRNVGSAINFAFEFGTKGTTNNNQVKENYVQVYMNFSINEIWFQKRQYF